MRIRVAAVLSLGLAAGVGCSHTTTISAKPAGTKIFVEDKEIGVDQGAASVPNGMGGAFKLRAEKEGYEPLEAEVSRGGMAMGPLAGAIGGCLGGGCAGALIGGVITSASGLFPLIPCCGIVMGGPFLALLLWMNQAPDLIAVDLDARTVTSTPEVDIKVSGAPAKPVPKTDQPPPPDGVTPEDTPDPTPPPGDDGVQPFDY